VVILCLDDKNKGDWVTIQVLAKQAAGKQKTTYQSVKKKKKNKKQTEGVFVV
jgi:hypothetical protein